MHYLNMVCTISSFSKVVPLNMGTNLPSLYAGPFDVWSTTCWGPRTSGYFTGGNRFIGWDEGRDSGKSREVTQYQRPALRLNIRHHSKCYDSTWYPEAIYICCNYFLLPNISNLLLLIICYYSLEGSTSWATEKIPGSAIARFRLGISSLQFIIIHKIGLSILAIRHGIFYLRFSGVLICVTLQPFESLVWLQVYP